MIKIILGSLIKFRNFVSKGIGRGYPTTTWEHSVFNDIGDLVTFSKENIEWRSDPIHGLLDHIQPINHMNWQLKTFGTIRGDCDDIATWIGYMLKRMGYKECYRVNIVRHKHVICVFRKDTYYQYFSNQYLRKGYYDSIDDVVKHWCERKSYTRWYYVERV